MSLHFQISDSCCLTPRKNLLAFLAEYWSMVLDRRKSLILLFDREDPRFDSAGEGYSQEYVDLVLDFVDEVVEKGIHLNRYSDQIRAHITAFFLYRGMPDTITLILTQEVDTPGLVRWVIADVEADFLAPLERDTAMLRFLSPVCHELGFMDLKKAFGEPDHLVDYLWRNFEWDAGGSGSGDTNNSGNAQGQILYQGV